MEKEVKAILQPATGGGAPDVLTSVWSSILVSVDDAIFLFVFVVSSQQNSPHEAQYRVAPEGGADGRGEEDRAHFVPQHAGHKVRPP